MRAVRGFKQRLAAVSSSRSNELQFSISRCLVANFDEASSSSSSSSLPGSSGSDPPTDPKVERAKLSNWTRECSEEPKSTLSSLSPSWHYTNSSDLVQFAIQHPSATALAAHIQQDHAKNQFQWHMGSLFAGNYRNPLMTSSLSHCQPSVGSFLQFDPSNSVLHHATWHYQQACHYSLSEVAPRPSSTKSPEARHDTDSSAFGRDKAPALGEYGHLKVADDVDPFALVADELASIGDRMRHMVASEIPKLAQAAEYFFRRGALGKRLRPTVLLLLASSFGDTPSTVTSEDLSFVRRRQQMIAEITEMIHVASLLHDDVLDHSDTRRGVSSLNFLMGNKLAVLAGDFLLARASCALASLRNSEVVELLSAVLEHLVSGEIMQLAADSSQRCSMDYYLSKTFCKTASLMANSCKAVAIISHQPAVVADVAYNYGRHLGLAFQLTDDALDFTGSLASLGKPALADLRQGIATAPVLFAAEQHQALYELVERQFKHPGDVEQAMRWVSSGRGVERTRELAAEHAKKAAMAIEQLPGTPSALASKSRRALIKLTDRVLERTK